MHIDHQIVTAAKCWISMSLAQSSAGDCPSWGQLFQSETLRRSFRSLKVHQRKAWLEGLFSGCCNQGSVGTSRGSFPENVLEFSLTIPGWPQKPALFAIRISCPPRANFDGRSGVLSSRLDRCVAAQNTCAITGHFCVRWTAFEKLVLNAKLDQRIPVAMAHTCGYRTLLPSITFLRLCEYTP